MSCIMAEELQAGIILGDNKNKEYVYMPGGEVGTDSPMCTFEKNGNKTDLPLADAVELAKRLSLKPVKHPQLGKHSY
ncbi:MAG: hypothetical protein PHQ45_03030 [Acidaminococcaceae bacterium]|nr:hypothetical protein [Acidaminococcaceae bacterium]